jgi:hypothetical protein
LRGPLWAEGGLPAELILLDDDNLVLDDAVWVVGKESEEVVGVRVVEVEYQHSREVNRGRRRGRLRTKRSRVADGYRGAHFEL